MEGFRFFRSLGSFSYAVCLLVDVDNCFIVLKIALKRNLTSQPLPSTGQPRSTRYLLVGIWGHLIRQRRIQLGLLLVVMLASGVAELLSLGAVLPFLAVLSDPQGLWEQPWIKELAFGWALLSQPVAASATPTLASAAVLAGRIRLANLWPMGASGLQLGPT